MKFSGCRKNILFFSFSTILWSLSASYSAFAVECREFKIVEFEDRIEAVCVGDPPKVLTPAEEKSQAEESRRQEQAQIEDVKRQQQANEAALKETQTVMEQQVKSPTTKNVVSAPVDFGEVKSNPFLDAIRMSQGYGAKTADPEEERRRNQKAADDRSTFLQMLINASTGGGQGSKSIPGK